MALRRAPAAELPVGAIRLTEQEALDYQRKAINQWIPASDMFALKYGTPIVSALTGFSGFVTSELFRRKCLLPKSALFAVGFPFGTASVVITFILHNKFITEDLMLWKTPCLVCRQTRSALITSVMGCIYPAAFTSMSCVMYAERMRTMHVPSLSKDPKAFFKFCQKMIQLKSGPIGAMCALNVAVGALVLYSQEQALFKLNEDM